MQRAAAICYNIATMKTTNGQAKGRKGNNMKAKRYIYEERKNVLIAKVYNYDLNTVKEMEAQGWTLTGTFYSFLTFRKDK